MLCMTKTIWEKKKKACIHSIIQPGLAGGQLNRTYQSLHDITFNPAIPLTEIILQG